MLVLTRLVGEKVLIKPPGIEPIELVITRIGTDYVRIGFVAEPQVEIDRLEIHESKEAARKIDPLYIPPRKPE